MSPLQLRMGSQRQCGGYSAFKWWAHNTQQHVFVSCFYVFLLFIWLHPVLVAMLNSQLWHVESSSLTMGLNSTPAPCIGSMESQLGLPGKSSACVVESLLYTSLSLVVFFFFNLILLLTSNQMVLETPFSYDR